MTLAFIVQHNTFRYMHVLSAALPLSNGRFARVTTTSCFVSWCCFIVVAIFGWIAFGGAVKGNVLNSFACEDDLANLGRLLLGVNMIGTYPLEFFACREAFAKLLARFSRGQQESPDLHFTVTTVCIWSLALVVGLRTRDVSSVFQLSGSFSGCAMAFILPGLGGIMVSKRHRDEFSWADRAWCTGLVVFGCVSLVTGTGATLANLRAQ